MALLLGQIELHRRYNRNQAASYYEQVLVNQPHGTQAELAQQGLERSLHTISTISQPEASAAPEALPELLWDPFLTEQPTNPGTPTPLSTKATPSSKATATAKATVMP